MTTLLDKAVDAARKLPAAEQDEIALLVLRLTGEDEETPLQLSEGESAAITASKAAAACGDFATDEQVRRAWAKHGL